MAGVYEGPQVPRGPRAACPSEILAEFERKTQLWSQTFMATARQAKTNYALSWNIQCEPHARLAETPSKISNAALTAIRKQIVACVEL